MKLEPGFASWPELVAALGRKRHKRRPKWQTHKISVGLKRANRKHKEQSRDRATFVRKAIEGDSARARPGATARLSAPGRWPLLLAAMGAREWTLSELCAVFDRPAATTHATLKRRLIERGLVERRENPNPPATPINGGMMAGKATRIWADRWLYRRTEAGDRVVAGSEEWRKPRTYQRWKYRRLRTERARTAESSGG